jgi:hypothetical protein
VYEEAEREAETRAVFEQIVTDAERILCPDN